MTATTIDAVKEYIRNLNYERFRDAAKDKVNDTRFAGAIKYSRDFGNKLIFTLFSGVAGGVLYPVAPQLLNKAAVVAGTVGGVAALADRFARPMVAPRPYDQTARAILKAFEFVL